MHSSCKRFQGLFFTIKDNLLKLDRQLHIATVIENLYFWLSGRDQWMLVLKEF